MILIDKFESLSHFGTYFIEHIELDNTIGYNFHGVYSGMPFHDAIDTLGIPTHLLERNDTQQTAEYVILVKHPRQGFFKLRNLNILLWAFHRRPIKIVQFKLNCDRYFDENREIFDTFLKEFINQLVEKFGKPTKKTFRKGKESVVFNFEDFKFHLYMNQGKICIRLTRKSQ